MNRVILSIIGLFSLFSCSSKYDIDNDNVSMDHSEYIAYQEPSGSKTALDNNRTIIWQKDDEVAIFDGTTELLNYIVKKENAGSTNTILTQQTQSTGSGSIIENNVAFFPYSDVISCSKQSGGYAVKVSIPSSQHYAQKSFGNSAMPMIAVTENTDDTNLSFRNLFGSLLIKLKGDSMPVKRIIVQGNNGEKLAGSAIVSCALNDMPTLAFEGTTSTSVKLECGNDVILNSEVETLFYVTLPPTQFTNGLTVTIESENGSIIKSITSPIEIKRNIIKPMGVTNINGYWKLISLEDTDGNQYQPLGLCENEYTVCVPKGVDITQLKANYNTDETDVLVAGNQQVSGSSINDYSSSVTFSVGDEGNKRDVKVTVYDFDLPAMYVTTPDLQNITSKDIWISNAESRLWNVEDCSITDLGSTKIKGRGNSTWARPKKPYAIKFESKKPVLGMNSDKRWNLLANYIDRTMIRNAVAFQISKCTDLDWTPDGRFVELFLNGRFQGNYFICEHIKLAKKRVNITEMSPEDISGASVTGGYITEITIDDIPEFRTSYRDFMVNIKEPDEDVIQPEQISYLQDYFNNFESVLYGLTKGDYRDYIDIDSFIDWWFVFELTMNHEPNNPKSCYMFKGRDGVDSEPGTVCKIKAGPVWDFDWGTFVPGPKTSSFVIKSALYYDKLFNDYYFVVRLKEKWNEYKADNRFNRIADYIDSISATLKYSDKRNFAIWESNQTINGDEHMTYTDAVTRLKNAYLTKLAWLDNAIQNLPVPPDPSKIADNNGTTDPFDEEKSEDNWN